MQPQFYRSNHPPVCQSDTFSLPTNERILSISWATAKGFFSFSAMASSRYSHSQAPAKYTHHHHQHALTHERILLARALTGCPADRGVNLDLLHWLFRSAGLSLIVQPLRAGEFSYNFKNKHFSQHSRLNILAGNK